MGEEGVRYNEGLLRPLRRGGVNSVSKMMNFALKMMNFVFKMMDFADDPQDLQDQPGEPKTGETSMLKLRFFNGT